jgi:hypothetical protein
MAIANPGDGGGITDVPVLPGGQPDPNVTPTPDTNAKGGSSSSKSKSTPTKYNKKASDDLLVTELLSMLGMKATAKMKQEFFKGLNAFLKAYGSSSSGKTSSSGSGSKSVSSNVQGADATVYVKQFIAEVAKDILKKNPKAQLGGIVGDNVRALTKYAADMGVYKSANEIINTSVNITIGKNRQEDALNAYRKDAESLYVNFSKRLKEDSSLTVRDLANPYIQMMADTFESNSDNIKLTDDTIQKAINDAKGLVNLGEFRTMLRRDTRFNTTGTAKREAANLATGMLRSMRFGA